MTKQASAAKVRKGEEGYLLLSLVVVCFLLLLLLSAAAPRVAKQLERDREVETEHRAQEYVRALQLFYRRNNRFPNSVDELLGQPAGGGMSLGGSNTNVRYLRQKYQDPLTGGDFRPIHFGEAKTEVKGFFGEPLQGMPVGNLGSVSGMVSNPGGSAAGPFGGSGGQMGSSTGSPFGSSSAPGGSSPGGGFSLGGGVGSGTSQAGSSPTGTSQPGTDGSSSGSSLGGTSATAFQGSKGAIIGFGSDAKGAGLVEWNGSQNIEDWEFLYDPRVELLKAQVSLFGGSPAASGNGSLGSGFAPVSGATGLGGQPGGGGFGAGTSSGPGGSGGIGGIGGGMTGSSPGGFGSTPNLP